MDPRLWQLLNVPPGSVYVNNMNLCPKNSTLTVDCRALSDTYPKGKSFEIQFSHCRDVRWQAVNPGGSDEVVEALGLFLGEEGYNKPAVVYTGGIEVSVYYGDVTATSK